MTTDLDASVLIGGVEYSQYLMSLERIETLNKPGAEINLEFSPNFPWTSIDPWDTLVVTEQGTLTLTGFVENIVPSREPKKVLVKGRDNYKRAIDYYTEQNFVTTEGQTIGYWTGYFCDLCGLTYSIDTSGSASSDIPVNPDIPFGFSSIDEILVMLCGIAQWQMIVTPDGVLHFKTIIRPYLYDHNLTNVETFERDVNDTDTRNRALIYGLTSGSISTDSVLYSETRVVPGVNGIRNMVYGSPNITTLIQAQAVATAALDQWARLDNVLAIDLIGDPIRRVGDSARYAHRSLGGSVLTSGSIYLDTVTDIKSVLNTGGYNQNMTLGRRAYNYPYFPIGQEGPPGEVPWSTSGSSGWIQDITYDQFTNTIYMIGNETTGGSNSTWKIEKRSASDGSIIWTKQVTEPSQAFGVSIVVDGYVYASVMSFSLTLSSWFSKSMRIDAASGSILATVSEFNESNLLPWMEQDDNDLYIIRGQTATKGVRKLSKPAMATQWTTNHGSGVNDAIGITTDYVIVNDQGDGELVKYKKLDGIALEVSPHLDTVLNLRVAGANVFTFSSTSGSADPWHIVKYEYGAAEHDPFFFIWDTDGRNNYHIDNPSTFGPSTPRGIEVVSPDFSGGATYVIVCMSRLYVALYRNGIGGAEFEYEREGSANSTDCFTCCVWDGGRYAFFAGRKDLAWYVEKQLVFGVF